MDQHENLNDASKRNLPQTPELAFSASNTIAVYTVLCLLLKMRANLGLEAMLEYIGKYLAAVEEQSPKLKEAVAKALKIVNIEKIYLDVVRYEKS